jgi:hypothetical protein
MNPKRTVLILMTAFATVWITDLIIHELLLRRDYIATVGLWRSPADMRSLLKWLVVGEFMAAAGLTVLWINRGAPTSTRPASAVRFGLFAGLITNAYAPLMYAVIPIPGLLCLKWVLFGTLQTIVVSLVLYYVTRALAPKVDEVSP